MSSARERISLTDCLVVVEAAEKPDTVERSDTGRNMPAVGSCFLGTGGMGGSVWLYQPGMLTWWGLGGTGSARLVFRLNIGETIGGSALGKEVTTGGIDFCSETSGRCDLCRSGGASGCEDILDIEGAD